MGLAPIDMNDRTILRVLVPPRMPHTDKRVITSTLLNHRALHGLSLVGAERNSSIRRALRFAEHVPCVLPTGQNRRAILQGTHESYAVNIGGNIESSAITDTGIHFHQTHLNNEDAVGYLSNPNDFLSVLADGVGNSEEPDFASRAAVSMVLEDFPHTRQLRPGLDRVIRELSLAKAVAGSSATTFTASRFFSRNRDWYFQNTAIGNSRSMLLERYAEDDDWHLVRITAEDSFPEELQHITSILFDNTNNPQKKSAAFELWKHSIDIMLRVSKRKKRANHDQLEQDFEAAKKMLIDSHLYPSAQQPQMNQWIRSGLFIFDDQQRRAHIESARLIRYLDADIPDRQIPEFGEPLLLDPKKQYLEVAASDGFWDIFDPDVTIDLLCGIDSSTQATALLTGAALIGMFNHVEAQRWFRVIDTELVNLTESEKRLAKRELMRRKRKSDHLTVKTTMLFQ